MLKGKLLEVYFMKKRIGLILHNIHEEYCVELIKGVERFCNEQNYQLILFPINAKLSEEFGFEYRHHAIKELINKNNIDGAIFSSGALCSYIEKDEFKKDLDRITPLPIVNIGLEISGYSYVSSNTNTAFKNNITHLITKHKKSKFLLLTSHNSNYDSAERKKCFYEVIEKFNIPKESVKEINAEFNRGKAKEKISIYLEKNGLDFECIICLNDSMAFGAIEYLTEKNYSIPNDIIVTGFDNSIRATFSIPTLSTIDPQISKQGFEAGKIINKLFLANSGPSYAIVDAKEKYRVSCGCISKNNLFDDYIDNNNQIKQFSKDDIYKIVHLHPQSANQELYILHRLIQSSLTVANQDQLFKLMPNYIKHSSLKGIAIFSYEKPIKYLSTRKNFNMPKKVKRIFSYEIDNNILNLDIEYFNPLTNAIPNKTFKKEYKKLIIYSLFEGNYQYGYIVATLGDKDFLFYEVLLEHFGKEITSAIKLSYEQIANSKLESKNTKLIKHSSKLDTLSITDELTQIYNRRGFMSLATKSIKIAVNNNRSGMIIFCDMDGLKIINDTYGHESGDKAIIMQTEILQESIRSTDIIGRLGGDEFAIAAEGMTQEGFEKFKKKIIEKTKIVNKKYNEKFEVSMSLGAAEYSKDNFDIDKLLSIADKELYKEKAIKHKNQN